MRTSYDSIGLLIAAAACSVPLIFGLLMLRRNYLFSRRQITDGVVVESTIETEGSIRFRRYKPKVTYEYFVGGIQHRSSKVAAMNFVIGDKLGTQQLVSSFPVGKQVVVYYNPACPNDAVLLKSSALVSTIFIITGLLLYGCIFLIWHTSSN
jgi:hypothetical protein